jgi:hypothetical protein
LTIANGIAPGQAEELIEMAGLGDVIGKQSSSSQPMAEDRMIPYLIDVYKALEEKQYPFIERVRLLSILPEDLSNRQIIKASGCSKYVQNNGTCSVTGYGTLDSSLTVLLFSHAIKAARSLRRITTTPTHHENPEPIVRNRINPRLTDHFLSWLLETGLLGSVAWGTTKITLDHGHEVIIPKQVLQAKKSHTIHQYKIHWEEMWIKPLSDRTLHYLLDGIGATEQHSISGVDDFVKEAHEGWRTLEELVQSLSTSKTEKAAILSMIEMSRLYLKSTYVNHCAQQPVSTSTTHCCVYALSQHNSPFYSEECDHDHQNSCQGMFASFLPPRCFNRVYMLLLVDL